MKKIFFKKGYKYQLQKDYRTKVCVKAPAKTIITKYIQLDCEGNLLIRAGYAWDGPSGPTFDTLNFMRGSLVHDALYQLMRLGLLSRITCREPADRLLQQICIEDGMSAIRAWWVYYGVHIGGQKAVSPMSVKKIYHAP